jgi:gliding motility-associated protein GldM
MSIPKEPRQLMINLMYLVLTALLALNISAEVMNAFFTLDTGIKNSNTIIDNSNTQILTGISKQADAYKNPQNDAFLAAARSSDSLTSEFVKYVDDVRKRLFDAAGGPSKYDPNQPVRIKDKDVTTRMFVMTPPQGEGVGPQLEERIRNTRKTFLDLVGNDEKLSTSLPLDISEDWKRSDKKSWSDFTFMQMPVAAIFPILRKIENDARASNSAVLNYFFEKVSGEEIKFDAFEPVVSASKGYVIRGEKYSADVFLSAFSTSAGDNTKIYVNGASLPVREGKASYETVTSQIGTKQYNVEIKVINPLTGEEKSYKKTFEYEVGERSVTVSADKMNVFYIGVENPVSVSAAGVSSNDLQVTITGGGGTIKKVGSANFMVEVTEPSNDVKINISAPSIGLKDSKPFRSKRIPDPVAKLGNLASGNVGNGEFRAQLGVAAHLENFDFDARCAIQSFTVYRAEPRKDIMDAQNEGARFSPKAQNLINMAKPGDRYTFMDIKARCPGDKAARPINALVFDIR